MPSLEQLLRLLDSAGGDEAILVSGRPISFLVQGAVRPVYNTPATTEQIVELLSGILPAQARAGIQETGAADFRHDLAEGIFVDVHVEQREGLVFVRLRRPVQAPEVEELVPSEEPAPEAELEELLLQDGGEPAEPIPEIQPSSPPQAATGPAPTGRLLPLLTFLVSQGASDLHLSVGSAPRVRLHGLLMPLSQPPLAPEDTESMLRSVLTGPQLERFQNEMALDFSFDLPRLGRFRSNACRQRKGVNLVFRAIRPTIPTLAELGLPKATESLTQFPNGLVLVTGPAGCGKTTTQAALINRINETWKDHIITVEDPIEYVHPAKGCLVNQREVGTHVRSFAEALKSALREDPDVILVGELRDLETIQLAITAAETGHLVLATLHTVDSARTIDRLIDVFPGKQKVQIRGMVSESLRGVISQQLIRTADGKGRIPAFELLLVDRSASNLIREGKTFQLANTIRLGKGRGMCALDDSVLELFKSGKITAESALEHAGNPDAIRKMIQAAAGANQAQTGASNPARGGKAR